MSEPPADWIARVRAGEGPTLLARAERDAKSLEAWARGVSTVGGIAERLTPKLCTALIAPVQRFCEHATAAFAKDAWPLRSSIIALSQLQEHAGNKGDAGRTLLRVADAFTHERRARELLIEGHDYDGWLEFLEQKQAGAKALPRIGARLKHAKTPQLRALLEHALPKVDEALTQKLSDDVFRFVGVRSSYLADLRKPLGDLFRSPALLAAFDDDAALDGVLVLPPAARPGLYLDTVLGQAEPRAAKLLKTATRQQRVYGLVFAFWKNDWVADAEFQVPDAYVLDESDPFIATVTKALGEYLMPSEGAVWRYRGAPYAAIEGLGKALGKPFLDGGHNSAPTPAKLLKATKPFAKDTTFSGFVVLPPRKDAYVAVDGVLTTDDARMKKWGKGADEYELTGDDKLWLWWD